MKHVMLIAGLTLLGACAPDAPPEPEPPAEPDGGVLGEAALDAQRRAEEAVQQVEDRKRELDEKLNELEGND